MPSVVLWIVHSLALTRKARFQLLRPKAEMAKPEMSSDPGRNREPYFVDPVRH